MTTPILSNHVENKQISEPAIKELVESSDFKEMLANIPSDEKIRLDHELNALRLLEGSQNRSQEALEIIEGNDFKNSFVMEDCFDDWALLLLKQGKITKQQMASAMMHKAAIKDGGILEKVELFIGESINPKAWDLIRITLTNPTSENNYISDEQLQTFFKKMRFKPKSEQCFFVTKDPRDFLGNKEHSVTQVINLPPANFNALCTIGKKLRMSPSASMMEAMIQTKYESNAGSFHFVFGLSSNEALLEGLKGGYRDVGIAHYRFPVPKQADNHKASNWEFSYHDFFHLDAFSAIPEKHRLAFYEIAKQIERLGLSSKFEKAFYETICDGEHPVYRKEANPNEIIDDSTFWFALFSIVYKAADHIDIRGNDAQVITQIASETIFHTLGKEVGANLEHFCQKFGLSAPSIIKALQRISLEFIQDFAQTYGINDLKKVMASHPIIIFVEAIQQQTGELLV